MKKCASCTKDLPDAALHCVFCGAKQPPAPAVQQGLAKTAFGYSANDVLEQVKQGRPPRPAPAPQHQPLATAPTMAQAPMAMPPTRPAPPSAPPPMAPPPMAPPPMTLPAPTLPAPPPGQPYAGGPQGGFVPQTSASAKTMFVQAAPPQGPGMPSPPAPNYPQPGYPQPPSPAAALPTFVPPVPQPMAMPAPAPVRQPQAPIMPIPAAQPPPYLASHTASRAIRPVDPWQDSLRAMMFLWGLALLAAFATPLSTSPLVFHWTAILDGAGTARLPPLTIGAVGLLGVILAVIPMPTAPRGLIAAVLALGGIAVPIALAGLPPWQVLAPLIGAILLVPGLLIRDEYRGSLLARLLVTLGAIGFLLPLLVPQNNAIPLVSLFKALIDLPGAQKAAPALALGMLTIVVMSLLAWLPSPTTGAAKLWAWLVILWALVSHVVNTALAGNLGDAISHSPNATLASWVVGAAGAPGSAHLVLAGSAYLVLVGYGLAAVLGKQLE